MYLDEDGYWFLRLIQWVRIIEILVLSVKYHHRNHLNYQWMIHPRVLDESNDLLLALCSNNKYFLAGSIRVLSY